MAKDVSTEPAVADAQEQPETAGPSNAELIAKVEAARAEAANLESQLVNADRNDIRALLELSRKVEAAQKAVEKAERAAVAAEFERRTAERMATSIALKAAVEGSMADVDGTDAFRMGIRTVTVKLQEDGSFLVDVGVSQPTGTKAPRTRSAGGTGNSKPRSVWTLDGVEYSSRELLLTFGGEAGEKAVDKAANYEAYGLKSSPGFDAEVKKLATAMGWDGDKDNRTLKHEPAA